MIASQVLTASQLANDTQIQLELAHTAGNETVVGSFALGSNGDFGAATTFSPSTAAHVFDDQTFTRAQIMSFSNDGVIITGAAEEGQILTAETVTNDPNATINYQWEESTNSSFSSGSVTDIGADSATYVVQQSDENDYIRVVATTSDPSNPQPAATATSAATGPIIDDAALSVSTSVVSGAAVQIGQTLVSSATITGDSSDLTAPVTYQWQVSNDGGTTWSDVPATTTGQFSGQLSSFYQISQADLGDLVRVQATFTDDTGQIVTAASTPTVAVAEIAPILTVPFSYAVDEFTVSDGLGELFADTFNNGPPPIGGLFGSTLLAFQTSSGGSSGGGSTWSESGGQAIMSSSGAAYNGTDDSVQAILLTSNLPEGSGTGESNSGLKENDTFTVTGTFDLVVPQPSTSYGIELNEALPAPGTTTQQVQIQVFGTANGGAQVDLGERDPATGVFTLLASYTLTAAQLSGNSQIELDLVHDTANSTAIAGSFELIDNGTSTFSYTFSQTGELFADSTAARALIQGISTDGVLITGTAQQGQTLTAETSTNDPNATISYQWQESNNGGQNWTAITGATNSTYTLQATDVGETIEVVARASDPLSEQSVTATSAPTTAVTAVAQADEWLNPSGGTWTDNTDAATNWSDGALPRSVDDVLIDLAGSGPYTVTIPNGATADAASLTLDSANATLLDQGTLVLNGPLTIDAGDFQLAGSSTVSGETSITNGGTFEIAGLDALATSITNTTGTVQVDAGSTLTLSGASISGGAISIAATGELVGSGTSAIDNATIDNSGSLETGGAFTLDDDTISGGIITGAGGGGGDNSINIDAADTLTLNGVTAQGNTDGTGTVDNSGTIVLENTLTLGGVGVTLLLDDAGTVSLNGATIAGSNSGETLENNANTISGAGQIGNGNGDLTLQNDADGNITAQGGTLTIDAAVTNDGTMTAASGAILDLAGQVSGTGSTVIDAGGTAVVGALDSQAITYDGVGTLQITPTGNLTGAIGGLVQGDVIDFTDNTSITSTSISGSTLTVDESSGGPLTYTIGGAIAGDYFAIQSDGNGGDELVLSPVAIGVTTEVVDNLPVQVGQTLVATATITGDATDDAASITYQWQISSNGGETWTDVGGALAGNFDNGQPSSFLQLTAADQGDEFRTVASIIDDTGQTETATSTPTTAVTDVTAEITPAFTYAVDDLSIVKNGTEIYNDTFSEAPPASPTILKSGVPADIVFLTLGSTWTESDGQAILSSAGVAPSTSGSGNAAVTALLDTNTNSADTTEGLKVGAAFTVSSTFALTALPPGSYGMQLNDGTSTHGSDQVVSLLVQGESNGSTVVELLQQNYTTDPITTTVLASQTLTADQLAGNTQIEFQLAHVANSTAITATFELLDDGTVTGTTTFTPTGTIFTGDVDWTRVDILAVTTPGVGLNVAAGQSPQVGQTLTANATTNDPDATGINYQWEESTSSAFTTFSVIGTNSASYTVQASDLGDYIRVVAATSDDSTSETSAVTGAVVPAAPAGVAGQPINLGLTDQSGVGALTSVTIKGMPSGLSLNEGTNLGNGSWTVQTDDLAALTVLTASVYAGAALLEVTESWANPNGSTAVTTIADNVEAYTPGSPIFAWSGDDTLTGAGGNDLFVFAQPIGNDTIYNFNVATDQIDLVGFAGITSFGDLAGQIAGDGNGDTVITLGVGETITLHGVDAARLTAADFVFDQTPVLDNAGTMTVSDGAMLPLGGIIDNTGTIAVNSTGDDTDLQIVGDGVTLEGGGQVILSDSPDNMIVGTNADAVLTNVDDTISGAGQIGDGDGNLTLVNETAGTIDANDANGVLTLDTGNTIVNAGLLEATDGGMLQIDDNVANSGTLAANGGTIVAAGDVTGAGDVAIGGGGAAEFAGTFDQNVTFTGPGVLELEHSQNYGGTVSGFATGDAIDLNDLAYSADESLTWTQGSDDGVLTVDDNGTTENIRLDGNYIQSEFAITQDATAAAGTDVLSVPSVDATAVSGSSEVTGDISLAVINANDTFSANVTPDGSNYVGSFSLDPVTGSNGNVSVGFDFMADDDQMNLTPGQTLTQSYNVTVADAQNPAENVSQTVSVTVGGAGNDSFVFAPGIGADTITNFSPQQDTLELNDFVNAQTAQELQALITTDAHGDAVIDLGHNDSITLAGVTDVQLQQAIQAGHVLLH